MKLVFCVWLVLPMFNGAAYIYENYARTYVKKFGNYGNYNYPEEYKKVLHMMTFDARKAVERYIDRFGPDAFERVIRAVCYKQLLSQSYKYIFNYYKKIHLLLFFS